MEYCQSTLPVAACISMNVMSYLPALVLLVSSICIARKKSFVFEMKCKQEYEENPQLIERSKMSKMIKQIVTLINSLVCVVFLIIYSQEPAVSITILTFYSIQGIIYLCSTLILQSEHKRQGQTSLILIANYIMNFFVQAGMGVIIKIENSIDTHCFALLIILQATSLVTSACVYLMKNDYTKEALILQADIKNSIRHKSTTINNNLLDQSCDQENSQANNVKDTTTNLVKANTMNKKNARQSLDNQSFKDFSIADIHNVSSSDNNAMKRRQSAQYASISRSDTQEVRDVLNNRLTPSFSHSVKQSTVSNYEEEPKIYLYAYRDIKVIGYKAKENQMLFVISYFRGIKEYKTDRTHKDFKYLSQQLTNELKITSFSLPQLPKRIQKTGVLDKKLLKDKMTKYNRFLYYIEFNKIESKEFTDFLLPVKERPQYSPVTERSELGVDSFLSSFSPSDSMLDSLKSSPKNQASNIPKSPSTFSRSRVSSEAYPRQKSDSISFQANSEPSNEKNITEIKAQTTSEIENEISVQKKEDFVLAQPKSEITNIQIEQCQNEVKKECNPTKDSTLSTSTQASTQANRFRSQTTSDKNSNANSEQKKVILTSRKRQYDDQQHSFLTQSEQQSFDSSYNPIEERQGSALSEGQEVAENNSSSTRALIKSQFNSISQAETNANSTNNIKSSAFSFSKQSQLDQSTENVFFKSTVAEPVKVPLVIIPQTKEINGKTVKYYINQKLFNNNNQHCINKYSSMKLNTTKITRRSTISTRDTIISRNSI